MDLDGGSLGSRVVQRPRRPLFSESNSIDPCDERCIPLEDKESTFEK